MYVEFLFILFVVGLWQIIRSYDPGYFNTAVCRSKITYIDGDKGILEYRGYPIEQLADKSSFLEVSFLLIYGFLPNQVGFNLINS